jgi:hypothetical protein
VIADRIGGHENRKNRVRMSANEPGSRPENGVIQPSSLGTACS